MQRHEFSRAWGHCAQYFLIEYPICLVFPYRVPYYIIHWFNGFGEPIWYDTLYPFIVSYHMIHCNVTMCAAPGPSCLFMATCPVMLVVLCCLLVWCEVVGLSIQARGGSQGWCRSRGHSHGWSKWWWRKHKHMWFELGMSQIITHSSIPRDTI
jgi:hypothetical protein